MTKQSLQPPKSLQFTLTDGMKVLLRPVRAEDRTRLETGVAALSSESRYFRFFTTVAQLSDQQLRYFSEVDHCNHVAWIALDASDPKHPGLGVARFVRSSEDPTLAEAAFVVIDAYQRRGLGTILLAILYVMAEAHGVQMLRAIILSENTIVSNWWRSLGAGGLWDSSEYRLDLSVHHNAALLPRTHSGENLAHAIEEVQALVRRHEANVSRKGRSDMQLVLTYEEKTEVLELVREEFEEIQAELHHTKDPGYRDTLKRRHVVLDGLLKRLQTDASN
jgi:GNAT superfamily N-acetyltransferase